MFSPETIEFIQSCLLKICVHHVLESNTSNKERNELDTSMMTLLKFVDAEWTASTTGVIQCHEDTPEDAILLHTEF